jgi:hypothetical protein
VCGQDPRSLPLPPKQPLTPPPPSPPIPPLPAAGLEDVADSYRTSLLHLLRLSTREAESIDARQRESLLVGPIERSLKEEAGPFASLDSPSLAPSPFDFQRVHCHAINVRLAHVYVRSKALQRHHRLYRVDKPGAVAAAVAAQHSMTATVGTADVGGRGHAVGPDTLRLGMPKEGSAAAAAAAAHADASGARLGQVEVFFGTRAGVAPEECAALAVPFELELVRAPPLGSLDAVAASSVTLGAFQAAAAITPSLYQPEEDPFAHLRSGAPVGSTLGNGDGDDDDDGDGGAAHGGAHQAAASSAGQYFAMEEGEFPSHMAAGGAPIPAPSAIPTVARAHPASAMQLFSDYTAHTELILSPYFADTCGLHEGDDGMVAAVLGSASLFCYEHVTGMVPLSQLIRNCGRLPEGRLLFRHLATELIHALADVEAQCTFSIAPGSITSENIYLSEGGTRLTVRGVAWGDPIAAEQDSTPSQLANRSRTLLRTLGEVLRDMLVESAVTRNMEAEIALTTESDAEAGIAAAAAAAGDQGLSAAEKTAAEANKTSRTEIEAIRHNVGDYTPNMAGVEEVVMVERAGAERGLHVAEGASIHLLLPHSAAELDLPPAHAAKYSAAALRKAVWLAPLLQVEGASSPAELTGKAAVEAHANLTPGRTLQGAFSHGGLTALVNGKMVERAVDPDARALHPTDPDAARERQRTRYRVRAHRAGKAVLHFYLVDPESPSAVAAARAKRDPRRAVADLLGPTASSSALELARSLASSYLEGGYGVLVPSPDDVLAVVAVPLNVYPRSPSPTLSSLLDACDPVPEESAAVASLRLLAAMVARNIGMVNGKRNGSGGGDAGGGAAAALAPLVDQIHDDESFLVVMRQVSAILRFNKGSSVDASALPSGGGSATPRGGDAHASGEGKSAAAAAAAAATAAAAAASGGGGSNDINDVDALAALINAMERPAPGEDGVGGEDDMGSALGLLGAAPTGGSAADADAAQRRAETAGGAARRKKTVRWVSHLARHPYFASIHPSTDEVMDDYNAWAHPLTQLATRVAAREAAATKARMDEAAATKAAAAAAAAASERTTRRR